MAPRPRLFRRLDEALRGGVAWVEGPPGSGKTLLVASYLERRRRPTVWYRIDEADGDIATFFHYLVLAAARASRSGATLPRFRPDPALDVAAFTRHFMRALYASMPERFTLALDDYHEVPAGSPLHGIIRAALTELPEGARAVVMSRSGPPPVLARLRASGVMGRLRADELRLTPPEARALVRLRSAGVSADESEELVTRAGGWAAGLTLLVVAGEGGSAIAERGRGLGEVFEYFAGEVLDRADPATQRVLLETALLGQVSAAAARGLTGVARADVILADLADRGYFTVRHGDSPLYTYHPLFRQFLLERGRERLPPGRLDAIRVQAARLVAESGAIADAAALLREAGAHDELIELVRARGGELLASGRAETLRHVIDELPQSLREREGWVQYWLGVSWLGLDLEGARLALALAHGLFLEVGDARGAYLACAAIFDSYAFEWTDFHGLDRWIDAFADLRRRWPEFPDAEVEASAACGIFTALMSARPEDPDLPAWERHVAVLAGSAEDESLRARAGFALAHFSIWRGDLAAARAVLAGNRSADMRTGGSRDVGWLVHAARAAATQGEGQPALDLAAEALALAGKTGNHWWDFGCHLIAVWGATLVGDERVAAHHVEQLERSFDATMEAYFEQVRALRLLRFGRRAEARDHLRRSLVVDDERGAIYPASWDHVALAAIAFAERDEVALARHLGEAERLGKRTRSVIVRYWTLLLRASIALATDGAGAARLAAEVLRLSREAGPFDEMWIASQDLARVCALALEVGSEVEEARAVVGRRGLQLPGGARCDAWPWPVAVRTLGPFTIERFGSAAAPVPARTRPVEVLQALVGFGGHDVPEWKLAEGLWPDAEGDAAQHALESNLHRLRRLLAAKDAIRQEDRKLSLDGQVCWVDVLALEAWLAESKAPRTPDDARRAAERLLALYRGPFLPAHEATWARPTRERLRRRIRSFVERMAASDACREVAVALWSELARRDEALATAPPLAAAPRSGAA